MTRIALVLVAATATAPLAEAQSLSFDRLALQLNQGDRITVTGSDGQELQGRIVDLSSSTLSLETAGLRRDLSGGDVSVIRRRERDSLKNGAAIGFASGAAIIVGLVAQYGELDHAGFVFFYSSLFGAAGAGIGAGLDALHENSRVIYSTTPANRRFAVSPLLSRDSGGLSVSLGF